MTDASGIGLPVTELEVRRLGRVRRFVAVHPVASDVLVLATVVALTGQGLVQTLAGHGWWHDATSGGSGADRWFVVVQVAAAVVGVAALAVRRHRPVPVLVVATGVIAVSVLVPAGRGVPAGDLAYPFALYAVAANRRPRTAWTCYLGSLAVLAAAFALGGTTAAAGTPPAGQGSTGMLPGWGPFSGDDLGSLVSYLLAGVVFLAVGLSVSDARARSAELVRRSRDLVAAAEQQTRLAAIAERTRIAREMHDVVSHSLSVMIALADGAAAAAHSSPQESARAMGLLSGTGRAALEEMRGMLGVLRDGPPSSDPAADGAIAPDEVSDPQPTDLDDLAGLVDRFRAAGLPVRWRAEELPDHQGLRRAVFRVVQESLTNVLRHVPGAGSVEVVVAVPTGTDSRAERVVVTVTDDGGARLAAPSTPSPGRGLVGIRERTALFDGTAQAGPHGRGWRVRAELLVPVDAGHRPCDIGRDLG